MRRRRTSELAVTIPEELVDAIAGLFDRAEPSLDGAAPVAVVSDGSTGYGSAWAIGPGQVVTAAHVAGAGDREVSVGGAVAELVLCDPYLDVALLDVEEPVAVLPLLLARRDPAPGTWVTTISYGGGRREERSCTVLGAVAAEDGWPPALVLDGAPHPGDSGAPLSDRRGEVVGMWVGADFEEADIGYAIGASTLREALDLPLDEMEL